MNQKTEQPFKTYWDRLEPPEKEALAKKLVTSEQYLYQIANGIRSPGLALAKKMEKETGIPRLMLKQAILEWMRA